MLLIYEPEGEPRQEFIYKPRELLSLDSEALEAVGGETWSEYDEFVERLDAGNLKARRALLWIFLRRDNPELRFVEVVVKVKELRMDYDAEEVAALQEVWADETADQERREDARTWLERTGHPLEAEPVGKDEPGESGTSSP